VTEALLNHQVQSIGGTAVGGDNHRVGGHDIGNSGGAGVEATKKVKLGRFFFAVRRLYSFSFFPFCVDMCHTIASCAGLLRAVTALSMLLLFVARLLFVACLLCSHGCVNPVYFHFQRSYLFACLIPRDVRRDLRSDDTEGEILGSKDTREVLFVVDNQDTVSTLGGHVLRGLRDCE
jgi:hypothetical protein